MRHSCEHLVFFRAVLVRRGSGAQTPSCDKALRPGQVFSSRNLRAKEGSCFHVRKASSSPGGKEKVQIETVSGERRPDGSVG